MSPFSRSAWVPALATLLVALVSTASRAQTTDDFFNPATLHRMDIWIHSSDWEDLKVHYEDDTKYPARLEWDGVVIYDAAVHSRGGGTRNGTKPGLRVDLEHYHSGPQFPYLHSFVLDNLYQDPSGVRETLAMQTHNRLGIAAPREAHTRLFVNGDYAGVYAIVEAVDQKMLTRVFGPGDNGIADQGYLFDFQWVDRWEFDYLGSTLEPYIDRFQPITHDTDAQEATWRPIEELIRLINDTPPERLEEAVGSRLDLEQFVRFAAIQNFLAENDGVLGYDGTNNFYFYRVGGTDRHILIPWDEDNALLQSDFPVAERLEDNVLMRGLMQVPRFQLLYYDTLRQASDSANEVGDDGLGWFEREARRETELISDAMHQDPVKPYTNEEVDAAFAHVVAYGPERAAYIRCAIPAALGQPEPAGCP